MLLGLLLSLFITLPCVAQVQQPLLILGNDTTYVSEFVDTYSKNNDFSKATEQDLREYLDLFIKFKMKVKEGESLKIDTGRRFKMELKSYEKQSAQQYMVDKEVTEFLLQEACDRSKSYLRASHILIACKPGSEPKDTLAAYHKAIQIRTQILNGEIDFAEAAVLHSDDPSARDFVNPQTQRSHIGNRGDLGYFTVFDLVYPFETAAYHTPVGQVSMPIRTQFGYHLIYTTEKIDEVGTIAIAQIFISDTMAMQGAMLPTTKERFAAIQADLKAGKTFEELATLYSEDRTTAQNGGLMEPFTPNRRQADYVSAVLKLKAGEISQPIPSISGWHLVKLLNIEKYELNDQKQVEIKNQLNRSERTYKSKASFINKLKKEYQYDDKNKKKGLKYIMASLPKNFFTPEYKGVAPVPADIAKQKPLCTFADTCISAELFFNHMVRYHGLTLDKKEAMNFLESRFNHFVQEKLMQYEYDHLQDKYPEFKALQKEFHDGMVLYEMNASKVWSAAMTDSVGLEKFYNDNLAKYVDPETQTPQPLDEIRALVITDYQDYLDNQWVAELRKKYNPIVNEKAFQELIKR